MPIYNGHEFIEESVLSILNQTFTKWELLIGINGHSENSDIYKEAKKYETKCENGKIRVFDFHKIKGKSTTLNYMIRFCNYNYVALLDVDDIWYERKLEIQQPFLDNYDVIGSNCMLFGDVNNVVPSIPSGNISNFDFSTVNPIINSSSIIKKEFCYWNSIWDGIEDYDLWLRLRKNGKQFYNCSEILVKHRIHNSSAFNSKGNHLNVDKLLESHNIKKHSFNFFNVK